MTQLRFEIENGSADVYINDEPYGLFLTNSTLTDDAAHEGALRHLAEVEGWALSE